MKRSYSILAGICLISVWSISGCQNKDTGDPMPDTGCRIEKYSATVKNAANTQLRTEQATFAYDGQGNLVRADSSWTDTHTNSGNTMATFTYSSDGFLTATSSQTTTQTNLAPGNTVSQNRSVQTAFEYANGRVTAYVTNLKNFSGLETTIRGTFDYDAAGNLSKQVAVYTYIYDPQQVKEIPLFPDGLQRTWVYADKKVIDYYEMAGDKQVRPYTLENGLVIKETRPDYYSTFEYDAQRRLIKQAMYAGGTMNHYYTQEWAAGKQAIESLPVFKGFPQIPASFGVKGILKKFDFYGQISGTGVTQLTSHTMTSRLNGYDFITTLTTEQRDLYLDAGSQAAIKTEVFTYTGCR